MPKPMGWEGKNPHQHIDQPWAVCPHKGLWALLVKALTEVLGFTSSLYLLQAMLEGYRIWCRYCA